MPKATTSTRQIPAAQAPLAAAPQDVIDMLNRLIDTCADGAYGFASCADYSNISRHRTLFRQRAQDCDEASSQLQAMVVSLGGQPTRGGLSAGVLHRGWVAVRGTLSGLRDQSILAECARGESIALERYRRALALDLPTEARVLVQRQCKRVESNLSQMQQMREVEAAIA